MLSGGGGEEAKELQYTCSPAGGTKHCVCPPCPDTSIADG